MRSLPSPHHPHTAAHLDTGLQPERTAMAWSRTALACCIVSAFTIRWLPFYGVNLLLLPGVTLVAAVIIAATQQHRIRLDVAAIRYERLPVTPVPLIALVGLCWVIGAAGLILVALA
ncbi:MAG: DUF202 domain-containing protein [Ornithinimicrobium sp.]